MTFDERLKLLIGDLVMRIAQLEAAADAPPPAPIAAPPAPARQKGSQR